MPRELTLTVVLQDIVIAEADALAVGFFEDVRPLKGAAGRLDWLLCGSLSRLIQEDKLRGSVGEVALLTARQKVRAGKIFMIGLGRREAALTIDGVRQAARIAASSVTRSGADSMIFDPFPSGILPDAEAFRALKEGLAEGCEERPLAVSLVAADQASCDRLTRLVNGA